MLQLIGRCSYEIYLIHLPVLLTVATFGFNAYWRLAVAAVLIMAVGIGVAKLYSEPLNRWIRRAASRRQALAEVAPFPAFQGPSDKELALPD